MAKLFISLFRCSLAPHDQLESPKCHQAVWVERGSLAIGERVISAGEGNYVAPDESISATTPVTFIRFEIGESDTSSNDPEQSELVLSQELSLDASPAILRLDRVTFPARARAYWHMHPGPGIRYLTCGALELKSEHHTEIMQPGQAWFEDANSPAQATAQEADTTAFIRVMILPVQFEGKPTFKLLNPEDRDKPALQTNKRFFDQRFEL